MQYVVDTSSGQGSWSGFLFSTELELARTFLFLTAGKEDVTARVAQVQGGITTLSFITHPQAKCTAAAAHLPIHTQKSLL